MFESANSLEDPSSEELCQEMKKFAQEFNVHFSLVLCIRNFTCIKKAARLIRTDTDTLNDHTGEVLGRILISTILEEASMTNLFVEHINCESVRTVNYVLKLPSGAECQFVGYGDVIVLEQFSYEQRSSRASVANADIVRAVGEIQSGKKSGTVFQNEIYAAGALVMAKKSNKVSIIFYKNCSAHEASIDRSHLE